MSAHHFAPAGTSGKVYAEPEDAEIREIYPGASKALRTRRPGKLFGSEAGMATAEYAIATLRAVPWGLLSGLVNYRTRDVTTIVAAPATAEPTATATSPFQLTARNVRTSVLTGISVSSTLGSTFGVPSQR